MFLHGSFIALGYSLGGGPTAPYGVRLGERLVLLAGAAFIMAVVGLIGTAGTRKTDPHTWRRWAPLAALLSVGLLLVAELMAFWAFIGRYGPEQRAVDSFRSPPGGRNLEEHRIGGEQPEMLRLWLYPERPEADLDDEARKSLKRWSCTSRLGYEGDHDTARCGNHKAEIDVRTTTS